MRRHFRHGMIHHHPIRRGFYRPVRRGPGLLGLVGMAALGYTLIKKNQREQYRNEVPQDYVWDENTDIPDPS